jgi:16S rRNA (cytidine1402-2'-O)-methyltransferase
MTRSKKPDGEKSTESGATAYSKVHQKPANRAAAAQPSLGNVASKSALPASRYPAGLYIVATPIGNLGDMTQRAIETLRGVAVIACEDTRVTGGLLQRFGIATPMTSYHDHNADRVRPQIIARLQAGEAVALVSDAGTPLISDPGYKLVRACAEAGIATVPLPGPSALLAALAVAALPTDRVLFAGFLPAKSGARRDALMAVKSLQATLVFYESPQRLADSLADMAAVFGSREASVCRELTKLHEEIRRASLAELAAAYAGEATPKGEVVVVVAGAPQEQAAADDADIDQSLRDAFKTMSVRDAAAAVAAALNQPRRTVYARALALAKK